MEVRKQYAVVIFKNNNDKGFEIASEVPSCWLNEKLDQCRWPNVKHVGPYILKRIVPDTEKWERHNVKCVGFYDDVHAARQKADGFSSCDETPPVKQLRKVSLPSIKEEKKRKGKTRNEDFSTSDESDDNRVKEVNKNKRHTISSPPQLASHSSAGNGQNQCAQLKDNSCIDFVKELPKNSLKITSNILSPQQIKVIKNVQSNSVTKATVPETVNATFNETNNNNENLLTLPFDESLSDFMISEKSLSLQISELREMQQSFQENITESINDLQGKVLEKMGECIIVIRSIFERLDAIERAVNANQLIVAGANENADLDALLPLQSIEAVQEFEQHVLIGDVKQRLVLYLIGIGGRSAKECVSRMLAKIFAPSAAKLSSWCGQRGNFKVNDLIIIKAVKEAVRSSYTCTDKYFEEEAKEWFRQGTHKSARLQKKQAP